MTTKLFSNGTILSFDDETNAVKVFRNSSMLVNGDQITAIGAGIEVPARAEIIDVTGKILTPGFINTLVALSEIRCSPFTVRCWSAKTRAFDASALSAPSRDNTSSDNSDESVYISVGNIGDKPEVVKDAVALALAVDASM
ncbi:hypothetical protein LTR48_006494 [Friedmanniomyces endolithicus]|uniref:Amidohydrolase-related domain-containing protein n=1 Tax=Rachicladosporium monterosium TaxID=1507873 RepID=A0ABR0KYN4_9PEZI|nr:hypothetical protein LTR29_017994 [Friedmanniomyces endolithicus]KAK1083140.1 hypothetical protein LTR48_006494 [Friedmanniomyces endolithicus]KAK5140748.1 hypothetical protein LTR32_006526 [Rachicladosporium monterosium]